MNTNRITARGYQKTRNHASEKNDMTVEAQMAVSKEAAGIWIRVGAAVPPGDRPTLDNLVESAILLSLDEARAFAAMLDTEISLAARMHDSFKTRSGD